MDHKLFDSELKIMEIIWQREPISAKEIAVIAAEKLNWNKNTTYTVIKKNEAKGYIKRSEPGFICTSLITKNDVCRAETQNLIDKFFAGSKKALFSALLEDEVISSEEIEELRKMIESR